MENHIYNLMKAAVKKSQAIWRYDKYKKDSEDCAECQKLWELIHEEDKKHLRMLKEHVVAHLGKSE